MFPFQKKKEDLMIVVLRFAVGSVFVWFGIDKWIHPEAWFDWVAAWIWPLLFFSPTTIMVIIGGFEFTVGMLLLVGRLTRVLATVAGLYLFLIACLTGTTDAAVRDGALIGCCLALFISVNRNSSQPIEHKWLRFIWFAYVVFLFATGMIFIRHGGI